jgi:hypothetical protein
MHCASKIGVAIWLLIHAPIATAQQLAKVNAVELKILDIDEDGRKCGVTRQELAAAALLQLSGIKLQVVKSGSTSLEISTTTLLHPQKICFSSVRISVYVHVPSQGNDTFSDRDIWHLNMIFYSSAVSHSQQMRSTIEESIKELIADWNLAREQ